MLILQNQPRNIKSGEQPIKSNVFSENDFYCSSIENTVSVSESSSPPSCSTPPPSCLTPLSKHTILVASSYFFKGSPSRSMTSDDFEGPCEISFQEIIQLPVKASVKRNHDKQRSEILTARYAIKIQLKITEMKRRRNEREKLKYHPKIKKTSLN